MSAWYQFDTVQSCLDLIAKGRQLLLAFHGQILVATDGVIASADPAVTPFIAGNRRRRQSRDAPLGSAM